VLDPILATRRVVTLEPEQTAVIDLVYGAADSREACLALVRKYMDRRSPTACSNWPGPTAR
jgi:hypothetical protein